MSSVQVRTTLFQNHKAMQLQNNVPSFSVTFNLNYEVNYLPYHHPMNLKSVVKPSFFVDQTLILDESKVHKTVSTLLSQTLVPESHIESVVKRLWQKANLIACDPRNRGFNVIPIVIGVRIIWTQEYSQAEVINWQRMLPPDMVMSFNLPAMEKSVKELEKIVYEDDDFYSCDSSQRCLICLENFENDDEMVRMPCFHVYHGDCIVQWLKNSHLCPSCRFPMPVCRVVDGTFSFLKRKRSAETGAEESLQVRGGKRRRGARMSASRKPVFH